MTDSTVNEFPCDVCGQPRKRIETASMTQWITSCACEGEYEKKFDKSIKICRRCHKKIDSGRQGSLTQWVFQSDLCECEERLPRTAVKQAEKIKIKQAAFQGFKDEGETELSLSADQFPTERYKPISILGEGAAGTVYMCRDKLLRKKVAVKVLKSITNEQSVAFQQEAKTTAKLTHPSIVKILDFGIVAATIPYMVMEYVDGETLKSYIKARRRVKPEEVVELFLQACDALSAAHKNGIFHRDLQANNIMVLKDSNNNSNLRIVDFGLAKIKEVNQEPTIYNGNTIVGTPLYMSPDQIKGYSYNASSEVYSIGCIMFEALIGKTPFSGETALETINMHATVQPPRLTDFLAPTELVIELDRIIQNCLQKEQSNRYSSADDLYSDLKSLQTDLVRRKSVIRDNDEVMVQLREHEDPGSRDKSMSADSSDNIAMPFILDYAAYQSGKYPKKKMADEGFSFNISTLVSSVVDLIQLPSPIPRDGERFKFKKFVFALVFSLAVCTFAFHALGVMFQIWAGSDYHHSRDSDYQSVDTP